MKKLILTAIAYAITTIAVPSALWAEALELTPYFGYRWSSQINGGELEVDGHTLTHHDFNSSVNFGLWADIRLLPRLMLEIMAEALPTTFEAWDDARPKNEASFDINLYYFHAGLLYEIIEYGVEAADVKVRPYVLGSLGTTILDPSGSERDNAAKFSASFAVGFKNMFTERIGLRLQGRYMWTYLNSANDYWCPETPNPSAGCTVFPSSVSLSQIDMTAGLIVVF